MPQDSYIEQPETVNLEDGPPTIGLDSIEDAYALQMVVQTFSEYETFRAQNHDPRWNVSDALYCGWLPQKVWEGTATPRSSLGMPIVFDQVEAALPAICQELFVPQDEWFQVATEPGTDPKEARDVQQRMSYVLEHTKSDYGFTARNEIELAIKDILLYGNGGVALYFDPILDRPVVERVDLRDFYIDPGTPSPNSDDARALIQRKMMTVQELSERRSDSRMKIPDDNVLATMAKNPLFAIGDQTKSSAEAIRGVSFTPNVTDFSPVPAERKIEVLIYHSKSKIIWILNRQKTIYNENNPYGFAPFCFGPCYPYPNRFYAQSIADVQEGNQRCIEGLLNGRLDAVTLALIPPRVYKRGVLMTPAQLKWRPGAAFGADDVKDMALLQPKTETSNVFTEISYLKSVSEERTGINSMTSGIPKPSNTNRTATGVAAVQGGTMSRLRSIVSNVENYLIVPMLYKLYAIMQKHTLPGRQLPGIDNKGNLTQVNSDSFSSKMKFRMEASSRMMTREKLAQIFPFLTQYMLNGTFIQGIQKTGQTVDFNEVFKMLQDATGTGRLYNFIRPMSQQEQQAAQTPPPEVQMQAQQKQQDLQTRLQIAQGKNQTDIQTAQIAAQNSGPTPQELQQDQQTHQMDMERENQRLQNEKELARIKIMAEMEKHRMDAAGKQQELAFKQQEMAQNVHASQAENAINLQQKQAESQMSQEQAQQQHDMTIQQGSEMHKQKLENMKQEGAVSNRVKQKAQTHTKSKGPK